MNRLCKLFFVMSLLVLGIPKISNAQLITAVEEDWVLDIATPNTLRGTPQITCFMSPVASNTSYYAVFDVNQRSRDGKTGGLQVHMWNGDTFQSAGYFSDISKLYTYSERVLWTQRMTISKGVLTFQIINGSSKTWGKFPATGELTCSMPTTLNDLNAYDPNVSAANSAPNSGHGRVQKLTLKQIRTYTNANGNNKDIDRALDRVVYPQ